MIEDWERWSSVERGLSERTRQEYGREIRRLGSDAASATTVQLRALLYELGGQPSTVSRRIAAWRSYFTFLVKTQVRPDDPTASLDRPRVKRGLPKPVADFDARIRLLEPEFQAIAVLLVSTGVRISELARVDEPLPIGTELRVLGKGGKERVIPLTPKAREALTFLEGRVRWGKRTIQRRLAEVGLHPHALRHTYATRIIASGGDIGDVKELLGHASVATSQIYAAYDRPRLRKAAERAESFSSLMRDT